VVPREDYNETSKLVCFEGIDRSPVITVKPHESASWSTDITLLAYGITGVGVIVYEKSKGDMGNLRHWTSNICYVELVDYGNECGEAIQTLP
jgi:hypothetical protein